MKDGFALLTNLDEKHNEVHRQAFFSPETTYITTQLPTLDSMRLGEMRTYFDGTDYWLFHKLSKTKLAKIQWTVI